VTTSARDVPVRDARFEHRDWQQYSVLVVDDEEGMRSFLTRTLGRRCGTGGVGRQHRAAAQHPVRPAALRPDHPRHHAAGKSGIEWLNELREHGYSRAT
jgi:DNA-binding NtrC family response regulator